MFRGGREGDVVPSDSASDPLNPTTRVSKTGDARGDSSAEPYGPSLELPASPLEISVPHSTAVAPAKAVALEEKVATGEEKPLPLQDEVDGAPPLPPLFGEEQGPPPAAPGVVVLGMHRSGTSLLSGLLFRAGLWVGERRDLIWGADASDNSKGFYERTDIVLQNDELMKAQKVHWSLFTDRFNSTLASEHHRSGVVNWKYGRAGLSALLSESHGPWLLKDPRLCLSLSFWLPRLTSSAGRTAVPPAVLFTYRHPVEVARSLQKREGFGIKRGLLLWLSYNQRALASSNRVCRVVTSNSRLNARPLEESNRVVGELVERCGLGVPQAITEQHVKEFVDPSLQRNHVEAAAAAVSGAVGAASDQGTAATAPGICDKDAAWASFGFLDAQGKPDAGGDPSSGLGRQKAKVLRAALEGFCDMESGRAFAVDADPGGQKGPFYNAPLDWG